MIKRIYGEGIGWLGGGVDAYSAVNQVFFFIHLLCCGDCVFTVELHSDCILSVDAIGVELSGLSDGRGCYIKSNVYLLLKFII